MRKYKKEEIKQLKEIENGIRYMVAIPVPQNGTAYIFVMDNEHAIEKIGRAIFVARKEED